MRLIMTLTAAAALAACTSTEPVQRAELAKTTCGAEKYVGVLGAPFSAMKRPTGQPYRVFRAGDVVTMDYDPTRVNFVISEDAPVVEKITCG
ncbi:MAG: I78 family peptidase inhibitor [Pseudomonadota bacterium]